MLLSCGLTAYLTDVIYTAGFMQQYLYSDHPERLNSVALEAAINPKAAVPSPVPFRAHVLRAASARLGLPARCRENMA
jgi:hypothetical protein